MSDPQPQLLTESEADLYVESLVKEALTRGLTVSKFEVPGVPEGDPRRYALKIGEA